MATIRERRPGVWEVRAYLGRDQNGRPIQSSRTVRGTKKDAARVAAEMTLLPSTASVVRVTVADMLELWVEHEEPTWAPSTIQVQRSRVRTVKSDRIALLLVSRLSAVEVDRWHSRLARRGVGEGSIKNQHAVLRAAMTLAVRWGWVPANMVAVARLAKRKTQPRGSLRNDQVRLILATATRLSQSKVLEPQAALALRLAAVTGARRSELAALRWEDFCRDAMGAGRITVDSSIAIIRAGDHSNPVLRDDSTKTANRRTVALDDSTMRDLIELKASYGDLGPWILSSSSRPVNPERVTAWWRRARDVAEIDPKWRLHDLRHWSATTSIAEGHDIRTVANRLGHANASMTLRVYAHAVQSADTPVASTLGRVLDLDEGTSSPS